MKNGEVERIWALVRVQIRVKKVTKEGKDYNYRNYADSLFEAFGGG